MRGLKALKGIRVFVYPFLVGNLKVYAAPVPACINNRRVESLATRRQHQVQSSSLSRRHIRNALLRNAGRPYVHMTHAEM